MNSIFRVIGLRIAKRRKELKYSQEYLAELTGVHRNFIGYVERAEKRISIERLYKIAKALNIPLEKIFQGL